MIYGTASPGAAPPGDGLPDGCHGPVMASAALADVLRLAPATTQVAKVGLVPGQGGAWTIRITICDRDDAQRLAWAVGLRDQHVRHPAGADSVATWTGKIGSVPVHVIASWTRSDTTLAGGLRHG